MVKVVIVLRVCDDARWEIAGGLTYRQSNNDAQKRFRTRTHDELSWELLRFSYLYVCLCVVFQWRR